MPDLAVRTQRLRTLENDIREGLLQGAEAWYYAGMKLREIRDEKLWEEAGFSSWHQYAESGRLDVDRGHANRLIKSSEYKNAITKGRTAPLTEKQWSQRAFAELIRVKLEDAPRVARKIEAAFTKKVEAAPKEEKETIKLSREFVRKIVDHELAPREPRQPKPEPSHSQDSNGDGNVHVILEEYAGRIKGWMHELEDVPQAGWLLLYQDRPKSIKRLIDACTRLAEFLKEKNQ